MPYTDLQRTVASQTLIANIPGLTQLAADAVLGVLLEQLEVTAPENLPDAEDGLTPEQRERAQNPPRIVTAIPDSGQIMDAGAAFQQLTQAAMAVRRTALEEGVDQQIADMMAMNAFTAMMPLRVFGS